MTNIQLRRLPWGGPDGQPAYLDSADQDSYLSRLADDVEAAQIATADELTHHAGELLASGTACAAELKWALTRCVEALRDVARVAESRGARIPLSDTDNRSGEDETARSAGLA